MEQTIKRDDCINSTERADTLLIVDDVELNRAVLTEIFKDEYRIEEAENGVEALSKLTESGERICAVLLDVVMPVMDGIELLKRLNAFDVLKQIPIFLITSDTSNAVIKEGYELGVMDVIHKPIVPYVVKRRVNSVIELFRARKRLGETVSLQAQKIVELNFGMIEALSTAIEFRSCESGEHVRRICEITRYLLTNTALGSGMSDEQIDQIALAAIMHDVGKIAVADSILNKPGKLTPEEFEIMKTHTVRGAELLDQIPQMRGLDAYSYARDIALHHHERWDGRGYPEGLKGDEISIPAQVVSLADVYDALVSKRVYKPAFSYEETRRMIADGECGVFGPQVLKAFLDSEPEIRKLYKKS